MSALCSKTFSLRIRPDLFGSIPWIFTNSPTAPGSAVASGAGRNVDILCVTQPGGLGGGGSATADADFYWINNPTADIQNCLCTVDVNVVNGVPPGVNGGVQHGGDNAFIFRIDTGTNYMNVTGMDTNIYTAAFPVPPGLSQWHFRFSTSTGPTGPPYPGGSIHWISNI